MKRTFMATIAGFLGFLLCVAVVPSLVLAAEEELQIGLPNFPRKITRDLPPLKPDQEIRYGILKLHPMFKTAVEYDDNITLSHEDPKEDFVFTQTPAIGVETKMGNHHFEGSYGMEIVSFAKDGEENAINHLANGLMEFNFNDFQLQVQDVFEKTISRRVSETSTRDHLLINTVEVLGRYDRPMWAMESGWRHNTIIHRVDTLKSHNYEEDVLSVLGGYKILPKTLLLLENDLGLVTYRSSSIPDHTYWQIFAGVRGDPTVKFSTTAKIGYQHRWLSSIPGEGGQSDYSGVVGNVDLLYRFTDNDAARLTFVQTVKTSTFGTNGWYQEDSIFGSYTKRFNRKWVLTPFTGWQFNDYPESATSNGITKIRKDNFWFASIELRYEIKEWLTTGLAYKFRTRNSNMNVFDFENHRIALDISLAY